MLKVEEKRIYTGCDCWGRREYDTVYIVRDECGNKIYESQYDPTKLIMLANSKENKVTYNK